MPAQRAISGSAQKRQQVYLRLRGAIDAGTFAPGARLPASREQARALGVSRNTVLWALERLQAEGYLVARVGDAPMCRSAPALRRGSTPATSSHTNCCRSAAV